MFSPKEVQKCFKYVFNKWQWADRIKLYTFFLSYLHILGFALNSQLNRDNHWDAKLSTTAIATLLKSQHLQESNKNVIFLYKNS